MKKHCLLPLFLLTSCVSSSYAEAETATPLGTETTRASLPFEIEGKTYAGVAVVDRRSSMTINFQLPKGTQKFMVTTCHREDFVPIPDTSKPLKYAFTPVMHLENVGKCWMKAIAINDKGETYMGLIEFRTGEELPGTSYCNGKADAGVGVGLCQARTGLRQKIGFDVPVVLAEQEGCAEMEKPTLESLGDRQFEYDISSGFCSYKFMDQKKRIYRLTTYGYQSIDEIKVPK